MIHFSDESIPSLASLSIHDPESSVPQPFMYEDSIDRHIEVLEQRRRDALLDQEASWAALNTLALALTAGNLHLL
jgi:hypothetical protein